MNMVNGLKFQQTCEDGQNQKAGTMTCDPLSIVSFHPVELILVHAT